MGICTFLHSYNNTFILPTDPFKVNPHTIYKSDVCVSARGLQRLVLKNIRYGLGEMYRGVFIGAQVKLLQRYIPEISLSDVLR